MSMNTSVSDETTTDQTPPAAGEAPSNLPWWRRPRRLRRQLAGTLAGTALISLLLVGVINYFAASSLLQDGSRDQLVGVAESRANSIELGVNRLLGQVTSTAADLAVVSALTQLQAAFDELEGAPLEPEQAQDLDAFYEQNVLGPLASVGIDGLSVEDVAPTSTAGRYLQYHYTLPVLDGVDRVTVQDAGDGSEYSSIHARFHPFLAGLVAEGSDVLLISETGDVVYSAHKRIDLGTNLRAAIRIDSELTQAFFERLPRVRTGEAILADFELSISGEGRPQLFAVAAVRGETEVVGAIAISVDADALSAITTANGDWEGVGLGEGESYVVGHDQLLRSESRLWIEDPEAYLDAVDDTETAELIETLGSPVLLQSVDTPPVMAAIDDETFSGSTTNYLGDSTFAYARPLDAGGLDWVVVAETPISQLRSPLYRYAWFLGLVLAVVLPVAAILGYLLADRLTRSIPVVVEMASDIAAGQRDLDIPDLGANEFGDLARRLGQMSAELGRQEAALADEFEQRRQLLLTVLPPRLVEGSGDVIGTGGAIGIGTVIAVSIEVNGNEPGDEDVAELQRRLGNDIESRAEALGIERIRPAHDRFLFLAGVDQPDDGADLALDFAAELATRAESLAESGLVGLELHIGMATGPVATGVLQKGSLTFTAWGEPVRQALAIGALSMGNQILVDESTATSIDDRSRLEASSDVIALDGQPMVLFAPVLTND